MTILIRGMEMPIAGQTIEIAENVDGRKYARIQPSFDEWHEVIEIPMPHGPLIDVDTLMGFYEPSPEEIIIEAEEEQ